MVLGAVALDTQHGTPRFFRIRHGEVDEESNRSDLSLDVMT
jgi:hypothetical protein